MDSNRIEEAKDRVRTGLKIFPNKTGGFVDLGLKIVPMTDDHTFRDELLQRHTPREAHL
jgi:hypothetical protein